MTETILSIRPRYRLFGIILTALGLICLAAGTAGNVLGTMIFGLYCLFIGATIIFHGRDNRQFIIDKKSITLVNEDRTIHYDEIDGLYAQFNRYQRDFPILLYSDQEVIEIPAEIRTNSSTIYNNIESSLPDSGADHFGNALKKYTADNKETFGEEKVFTYSALPTKPKFSMSMMSAVFLTSIGVSMIVAIIGAVAEDNGALFFAGFTVCLSLFLLLLSRRIWSTNWPRRGHESGLVISPVGFAMIQGRLNGKIVWDEIEKIEFLESRPSFAVFSSTAARSIRVTIPGSRFDISDIYDRPTSIIYDMMMNYWEVGREDDDDADELLDDLFDKRRHQRAD